MRLKLIFEVLNNEFPVDNKNIWVSYLKKALSTYNDLTLYNKYFDNCVIKDYTFSVEYSKPKFLKDKILLGENTINMYFSSSDLNKTGLWFFQAFISLIDIKFNLAQNNYIILRKIVELPDIKITSPNIICKTSIGGGIIIRKHMKDNKDKYLCFSDDEFQKQFFEVLKLRAVNAGFPESYVKNLKFESINCKKVVVKHYGIYVDVTCGTFSLSGNPLFLQYLYDSGLGSKTAMGYGMFNVIG